MPPGCVYTCSCWRLVAIGVPLHQWCLLGVDMAYIHHRRGACVARFDRQGNFLRASRSEASDSAGLHAFFMSLL